MPARTRRTIDIGCYFYISGTMETKDAVAALGALAQETRLQIFRLLVESGPGGMAAGAIGERLALPAPTLSFHLAQLKGAGLVSARREGRSIVYTTAFERMSDLLAFLTQNCCQGRPEVCEPLMKAMAVECG